MSALVEVPQTAVWLPIAGKYFGTLEQSAPGKDHPLIVQWLADVGLPHQTDETPWCSAFANAVMREAGLRGSGKANARSWEGWGERIDKPRFGCVAVLWRDSPASGHGHVAFWLGNGPPGAVILCGGNQANQVGTSHYPAARVLSYRWPDASCLVGSP